MKKIRYFIVSTIVLCMIFASTEEIEAAAAYFNENYNTKVSVDTIVNIFDKEGEGTSIC